MNNHKWPCSCLECLAPMQAFVTRIYAREEQPEEVKKRLPPPLTVRTGRPDSEGRFAGTGTLQSDEQSARECFHLGYSWSASEIARVGLNPQRDYRACALGMGERPGFVCKCLDCGAQCFWYDPAPHDPLEIDDE